MRTGCFLVNNSKMFDRIRKLFENSLYGTRGYRYFYQNNPSIFNVKAFCLCLQVYSQKTWGSCRALDGLQYMSSIICRLCMCQPVPYHTLNKSLVLEWPTFIDVCSYYLLLQVVDLFFTCCHRDTMLELTGMSHLMGLI